jgi:hypothetical protein
VYKACTANSDVCGSCTTRRGLSKVAAHGLFRLCPAHGQVCTEICNVCARLSRCLVSSRKWASMQPTHHVIDQGQTNTGIVLCSQDPSYDLLQARLDCTWPWPDRIPQAHSLTRCNLAPALSAFFPLECPTAGKLIQSFP